MNDSLPPNTSTAALLTASARDDHSAFAALVRRYFPLVYAAALRRCGSREMAEDAAQNVFVDLLRRAKTLRADERLGGWLHQRAVRAAGDLMKSELRRKKREAEAASRLDPATTDEAWRTLVPHVDLALQRLPARDRDAVLLRCMEGQGLPEVGAALGISADAAQKRVTRALEKLRGLLRSRGTVPAATAIAAALASGHAEAAALTAAAARVSAAALHAATLTAPVYAWILHAKAALAGTAIAAAAFAWPMAAALRTHAAAGSTQASTAAAPASSLTVRTPVALQFPALPRMQDGLSVEEIVSHIGALAVLPDSESLDVRFSFLYKQLSNGRDRQALQLMLKNYPPKVMTAVDRHYWRQRLLQRWGKHDFPAALDYAWEAMKVAETKESQGNIWEAAEDILRESLNGPDVCTALRWLVRVRTEMARLPATRRIPNWKNRIEQRLAPAYLKGNAPEIDDLAVTLTNELGLGFLSDVPEYCVDKDRLLQLLQLAPRLEAPRLRASLLNDVAERLGEIDFPTAQKVIEAIEHPGQRLILARRAAFPPIITRQGQTKPEPQKNYQSRADWYLHLTPEDQLPSEAISLAGVWMEVDPEWGCQWLRGKLPADQWQEWLESRIKTKARQLAAHGKILERQDTLPLLLRLRREADAATAQVFINGLKKENSIWSHSSKLNALLEQ